MFNTILFPIDQSIEARQASDVVVEMVKKYQARLVVLSVIEPEGDATEITALLEEARDSFGAAGITAETRSAQGKPAFVICDIADEIGAGLIIMGSRGMSLAEEHPDGSVSQKVINLSPCPVMVVP